MPRVPSAFALEILSPDIVAQAVTRASAVLAEIEASVQEQHAPGNSADRAHLERCLKSFLLEFSVLQSWKRDPTLYLRLINLALERVIVSPQSSTEKTDLFETLLQRVPRLLVAGMQNCRDVPDAYRTAALEMGPATASMLGLVTSSFPEGIGRGRDRFGTLRTTALEKLDEFLNYLVDLAPACPYLIAGPEVLDTMLRDALGCQAAAPEIYAWAIEQDAFLEDQLNQTAAAVEPGVSWRQVYAALDFTGTENPEMGVLYQNTVTTLADFFCPRTPGENDASLKVTIKETPPYLKPIRSDAAYRAPDPAFSKSNGVFFIPDTSARSAGSRAAKEHLFLSAHETFPGHHLLDYHRLRLEKPVRRFIEAPLFYEGWACYAEGLLTEWGLCDSPLHRLVLLKRRWWRIHRLLIEHDIHTARIGLDEAAERLKKSGADSTRARILARRYTFNPGYQTTYSWGLHRLLEQKRAAAGLPPGMFERILLGEGQIPFQCLPAIIAQHREQRTDVLTTRREVKDHSWRNLSRAAKGNL